VASVFTMCLQISKLPIPRATFRVTDLQGSLTSLLRKEYLCAGGKATATTEDDEEV